MPRLRDEKTIGIFRGSHYREVRERLFQVGCPSTPVASSDQGRNPKRPEKIWQKEEKLGLRRGARSQRWGCCSLGKGTSCQQLRRVDSSIHSSSLSRKLISNCSSSFLRGQGIAGREGGVPGEAARLWWKNPEAIWEAEETSLMPTSAPSMLPPLPTKSGRWGRGEKNP